RGPVEVKRQGVDGGEVETLLLAPVFARVLDGGDPLVPVLVVKTQGQVVFLVEQRGVVHQVGGAGQIVLDTVDALELGIQHGHVGAHAEAIEGRGQQRFSAADEVDLKALHPAVVAVDGAGVLPLLPRRARQINAAVDGGAVGVDDVVDGAVEGPHRGEAGVGEIPLQGDVEAHGLFRLQGRIATGHFPVSDVDTGTGAPLVVGGAADAGSGGYPQLEIIPQVEIEVGTRQYVGEFIGYGNALAQHRAAAGVVGLLHPGAEDNVTPVELGGGH